MERSQSVGLRYDQITQLGSWNLKKMKYVQNDIWGHLKRL